MHIHSHLGVPSRSSYIIPLLLIHSRTVKH
nr:MAG TPA: hypothetical protein [Caudoviricetes sp.]